MRTIIQTLAGVLLLVALSPPHFVTLSSAAAARSDPTTIAAAIDRAIDAKLAEKKIPGSGPADDAEFMRRAYLDITGRIPTLEKAAAFLDSSDPDKRRKLIDELLANPQYGEHLATLWVNLINAHGSPPRSMYSSFSSWLARQFNDGQGWNKIVHELLTATGTPSESPATYFVRANLTEPGAIGNTTAQFFLGVQIQCAECHDHPTSKWLQADYWGLAVYFSRLRQVAMKGGQQLTEELPAGKKAPEGPPSIKIPAAGGNKGAGKVVQAKFLSGGVQHMPAGGPFRPALADWITSPENPFFAPAAVNRMWAHFFGSGFVNPVDDFRDDTPPSHPELLQLLAKEFIASGYDQKHLVRCITLSKAYQRTSRPLAANKADTELFSRMAIKVMTPHVLHDSLVTALGVKTLPGGLGSPIPFELYSGTAKADRLQPREEFIRFFNTRDESQPATEYTHGIPQVLALMNAKQFNTVPPVVDKLVKAKVPPTEAIESLYLATLSRRPSPPEVKLMSDYLAKRNDPQKGHAGILWILFNSSEFVLNH